MKKIILTLAAFVLIFFLGLTKIFLILFLVVSLHEASHIIMSRFYGLSFERISFMPIGQFAVIRNLEYLRTYKRCIVVLIGPLCNMILGLFFYAFFRDKTEIFWQYNFVIAFFNLLPIVPLDGGKLFQIYFGNKIGVLRTNRILIKISRIFSILFIILGIAQFIIFKYNFSLILIGIYIYNILERENFKMATEFYKVLLSKKNKKIIKIENILVSKNTKIKTILYKLCWDKYFVLEIAENNRVIKRLYEYDFSRYVFNYGIEGKLADIIETDE